MMEIVIKLPYAHLTQACCNYVYGYCRVYTEQMSKDEAVAISLLNKKESVLKPLIEEWEKVTANKN